MCCDEYGTCKSKDGIEESTIDEVERIRGEILKIVRTTEPRKTKMSLSIKQVHGMVCEFVEKYSIDDVRFIKGQYCYIDYKYLDTLLHHLDTGWKRSEFTKALDRQGMIEESGNDRLAKKLTNINGVQYRALVFNNEFKEINVEEEEAWQR